MTATNASAAAPSSATAVTGASLAHGLSQIFFQRNVWTGLLILAAFVVADWRMALLVVVGTVASTAAGYLMRVGADNVEMGMQGFCGALVGAAVYAAMGGDQAWSYVVALVGGLLCAPVTWFFVWLFGTEPLKRFALPATTAPFCTVAGIMYVTTTSLHVSSAGTHVADDTTTAFFRSLLTNVSEVVLVNSVWAGALILLGLFVASWKVGLAASMGSVVGSLCALAFGENLQNTANGLNGYSGVLTAIALAVVFLRSTTASWVYALVGTIATAAVTILMHDLTSGPVYTWPYILTTWVFLIIATFVPALKRP